MTLDANGPIKIRARGVLGCLRTGEAQAFVAGVEKLKLSFSPVYMTSWGVTAPPDEVVINHKDGRKEVFATAKREGKTPDQPVISVKDLLALAGIDLEKQNKQALGFQAKADIPMSAPHRFMGGNLVVKLEFTNIDYMDPFSTKVVAELKVETANTVEPYGPGVEVIYKGSVPVTLQSHDEVRVEREWHGFSLEFEGAGQLGVTDAFALVAALTNAFVLIGMCTLAVDKIGELFSEQFYDDKYEDDEERAGLEKMLAAMESDKSPGVPFDPKDLRLLNEVGRPGMSYETALYTLMRQQRDNEARLNTLLHVSRNGIPAPAMAYDYARAVMGAPAEGDGGGGGGAGTRTLRSQFASGGGGGGVMKRGDALPPMSFGK